MITVIKHERRLVYEKDGKICFTAHCCLGNCPEGHKSREGDGRTPEGLYRVTHINTRSKFHTALGISYPNRSDAKAALKEKRISLFECAAVVLSDIFRVRPPWKTPLGGFIMIHGADPEGRSGDWTAGCIALDNVDIDTLAGYVKRGEPVRILP